MAKQPNAPQSRQDKIAAATPKQKKTTPIIAGLIVLVVVAGIAWAVMAGMGNRSTGPEYATPPNATGPTGGVVLNTAEVPAGAPTLDIYEDPQCPACAMVHGMLGATVNQLAESGSAKVVFHVKTFMDSNLRNDSSKRAGNAMMCAADAGKFVEYHDVVFENQNQEGQGWTDAQLDQFATASGITGTDLDGWKSCVSDKTYADYLAAVEDSTARNDNVTSTPTYRINGKDFTIAQQTTAADLEKAIVDAGGTPPTGSATPAPSAPATSN